MKIRTEDDLVAEEARNAQRAADDAATRYAAEVAARWDAGDVDAFDVEAPQ